MQSTKITLSAKERELVTDAGWILTKNAIIGKVYDLFGALSENYRVMVHDAAIPLSILGSRSPKISKGEQYEGLPWVMLDYPRNYTGGDDVGIRSFFWWGHFCSITLQVSGTYCRQYAPAIKAFIEQEEDWYIATGEDAWQHHFRSDNYTPANQFAGDIATMHFCKIAKNIPLERWDEIGDFFTVNYRKLVDIVAQQ